VNQMRRKSGRQFITSAAGKSTWSNELELISWSQTDPRSDILLDFFPAPLQGLFVTQGTSTRGQVPGLFSDAPSALTENPESTDFK